MPLFLHERDAFDKMVEVMERNREHWDRACIHCFTGNETQLLKYLEMGCYIGITGWICDQRRGERLRNIVHHIPLDKIMIETGNTYYLALCSDSPFLTPHNLPRDFKVRRNEPCLLPYFNYKETHRKICFISIVRVNGGSNRNISSSNLEKHIRILQYKTIKTRTQKTFRIPT